MKLLHKGIVLVLVPVAFECVFVGSLFYMLRQSELELNRAEQARLISTHLNRIERSLMVIVGGLPVFLNGLEIHGPDRFRLMKQRIDEEFLRLKLSVKDDPELISTTGKIEEALNEAIFVMGDVKNVWTLMDKLKSSSKFRQGKGLLDDITGQMDVMWTQMQKIEGESPLRQAENRTLTKELLLFGLFVNILMAVALAFYFSRDTVSRLAVVMAHARNLAEGKCINERLKGSDEIAALDRAFSVMAANLKELAQRERALLSNAADVICAIDAGGNITDLSPACEKVWGYQAAEMLLQPLINIVVPEDAESTLQHLNSAKVIESESSFENRIKRKDGIIRDMTWSIKWSHQEKKFYCIAHDNTDRKTAERMKQDFVSMLSHDLRSPLSSLQGFFTLISEHLFGSLNEAGMSAVSSLESTIFSLIEMIGDLLDIEKIESGLSDLDLKVVSLKGIVVKADEALDSFAGEEEIVTVLPKNDANIRVDELMVLRVVTNLLSNAIKMSPRHSEVEIEIEDLGDWVELRVTDRGGGIAEEDQAAIFERFRQVRADGSGAPRSCGLGLSVSRAIVQQHRGTIGVTSAPGEGSTFWVRLPGVGRAGGEEGD